VGIDIDNSVTDMKAISRPELKEDGVTAAARSIGCVVGTSC